MATTRGLLLVLIMILQPFTGCDSQQKKSETSPLRFGLEAIKQRGYIYAMVDNNSFSYFIYKGRPMGFEYELLNLFAKHLNVDLKIKVTSGIDTAFNQLNTGDCDILAFPLTITKERKRLAEFTSPLYNTYQVLVQRKPENWRSLTMEEADHKMIREPTELIDKSVHVMRSSSFSQRLENLSEEIGGDIKIIEDSADAQSESLIQRVALNDIDYTVTDYQIARVNAAYYPNLDVNTIISLPQQIAWGVRKNSPLLVAAIDEWLAKIKKEPTFMVVYNRYFNSPRTSLLRIRSNYSSLGGNKISPYDDLIKNGAKKLDWDWRLLASIIYQESRFVVNDESWAGARGLMQLMPETAKQFGATNRDDPKQSIRAGVKFLKYLDSYWAKSVTDKDERFKFVLASYNAGLTHVTDARELALKYKKNPTIWSDVEYFLEQKSNPKYYRDPIVMAGYCKCEEPVNYVKDVLERFEKYKLHIAA